MPVDYAESSAGVEHFIGGCDVSLSVGHVIPILSDLLHPLHWRFKRVFLVGSILGIERACCWGIECHPRVGVTLEPSGHSSCRLRVTGVRLRWFYGKTHKACGQY